MPRDSDPRISINELGKYIFSRDKRQRQILMRQKYRGDFMGMYYREATEAIATCLASNFENVSILERALQRLYQSRPEKIGTQRRINANADALDSFMAMMDSISFEGGVPELGDQKPEKLVYQGVEISVRPEIVLRGSGRKHSLIGGLKLHFSRTFPLGEDGAGIVSTVCQEYSRSCLVQEEEPYAPYCMVIDVGARRVYPGVRAITARMRDVVAACRNIAALWPTITEDE